MVSTGRNGGDDAGTALLRSQWGWPNKHTEFPSTDNDHADIEEPCVKVSGSDRTGAVLKAE